ncbi:hypothetical protein H5410_056546 [Solanum commersonii]|uniref:Uncharacterized protein n=1 Tax=Solanum commersonii TaxID=4109 RepID=A0A9J5WMK1_SOLCO|nr:hypothetical protein H5410_056546 [Solanum commersonii]
MYLLVIPISDAIFAKIFWGRPSRLYLLSRLVPMGKPTNFHGQTSLDAVNPPFCLILCVITLPLEPIGSDRSTSPFSMSNDCRSSRLVPTGKLAPFQGQTIPEMGKPPVLPIFLCYSPWIFW